MEILKDLSELIEIFGKLRGFELKETDGKLFLRYKFDDENYVEFENDISYLDEKIENLRKLKVLDNLGLYTTNYFEKLVKFERILPYPPPEYVRSRGKKPMIVEDDKNKINYKISSPSEEFLLYFIKKLNLEGLMAEFLSPRGYLRLRIMESEENSIFDFIRHTLGYWFITITISSKDSHNVEEFFEFMNSFKFQLGYQLDHPIIEVNSIEELSPLRRQIKFRRQKTKDLEPPRRKYVSDLIYYYQMGISSPNPILQYISYYQIMEFFFEKVYFEDLVDMVKNKLTDPSFSYKNDKSIENLINEIKSKIKDIREEEIVINEFEALKLILKKYIINLDDIKGKIINYSEELIEYYKTNIVPFSEGNKVNFNEGDKENIYTKLAYRIYKTRNCIIHSKESKRRYTPFEDDKYLIKEIPLIRFLAEEIIIQSFTGTL